MLPTLILNSLMENMPIPDYLYEGAVLCLIAIVLPKNWTGG